MQNKYALGILACALIVLCSTGMITAGDSPDIGWHVLAGGGGQVTGGAYTLDHTVGQTGAGSLSSGSSELCVGFWCIGRGIGGGNYWLYLPMVLR